MAKPDERPRSWLHPRICAAACPACGEGHLFRAFLKVADHCENAASRSVIIARTTSRPIS